VENLIYYKKLKFYILDLKAYFRLCHTNPLPQNKKPLKGNYERISAIPFLVQRNQKEKDLPVF